MKSHLDIQVGGESLALRPGQSIEMTLQNPLFNDIEAFSLPIGIPVELNSRLTKNVQDTQSTTRLLDLDQLPMTVYGEGVPLVSGNLMTSADEEIDEEVSINLESIGGSFSSRIADLRCCDVPLKDDIVIGEKVGQVKITGTLVVEKMERYWDAEDHHGGGHYEFSHISTITTPINFFLDLPALGFSYPGHCYEDANGVATLKEERTYKDTNMKLKIPNVQTSYINVTMPFDDNHPYCNARVCYKHYGVDMNTEGDEVVYETTDSLTTSKETEYEAMYPYWVLDADRPQSGICFYVLYFLRCLFKHLDIAYDDSELLKVEDMKHLAFFTTRCAFAVEPIQENYFQGDEETFVKKINDWAESRGCGGKVEVDVKLGKIVREDDGEYYLYKYIKEDSSVTVAADLQRMYATSACLPENSVSEVIESLENSFGIRFLFDTDGQSCKAVFIRDVFRSTAQPNKFFGEVISIHKLSEKTTGVKVCYDSESSSRDQRDNVRKGVRNYDTDYDYIDYPEPQREGTIVRQTTVLNKTYKDFFRNLSSSDMNCYIDKTTGNAFRIKIDEDAKTAEEWNPVLFEVGGYKGVEEGNCSESNKNNIVELTSHFQPVFMNDVNYQQEVNGDVGKPLYAVFIDEDMEHEFVEQQILSTASFEYGSLSLKAKLRLLESYDPTGTDDGGSPLQHIDWGLAVSMMRGGGSSARVVDYDPNYDGFGNYRWQMMNDGGYQMFGDTMDMFGGKFDYNGDIQGDGGGERFSLKMRAYKQPSWSKDENGNPVPLFTGDVKDRNRGLVDTFMFEYVHFLLNRRKYIAKALCTAAELADLPNHWTERFIIDGHVGYLNKVKYSISAESGLGLAEIEFFSM